jgi:redox-sensitive bicupin YhaK (pirin superfamily)
MVAGRGVTHSERFERARREGDRMHGIQAWIALPLEAEETDPSFTHHAARDLPCLDAPGMRARLVAGRAFGENAGVKTFSPMFYIHCDLEAGAEATLPDDYPERAAYVVEGEIEYGADRFGAGQMIVFAVGHSIRLRARAASRLMLLGGGPVGERFIYWNFVSSSRERIEQAKADWQAGRIKLPDLDHDEFIPLPEDSRPPSVT